MVLFQLQKLLFRLLLMIDLQDEIFVQTPLEMRIFLLRPNFLLQQLVSDGFQFQFLLSLLDVNHPFPFRVIVHLL
jgi:hypothetical protein